MSQARGAKSKSGSDSESPTCSPPRRAREQTMPNMTIVYWRDIPAQVIVGKGRTAAKVQLPERFEQAIDRCAMKVGASDDDAYLAEWRKAEMGEVAGDPAEAARDMAGRLDTEYDQAAHQDADLERGLGARDGPAARLSRGRLWERSSTSSPAGWRLGRQARTSRRSCAASRSRSCRARRRGSRASADILPAGTRVYVAHIEGTPIEDMVATARRLTDEGFPVMPHFPARGIRDRAQLADWIARYRGEAGIDQALLLAGGYPRPTGDFDAFDGADGDGAVRRLSPAARRRPSRGQPRHRPGRVGPHGHAGAALEAGLCRAQRRRDGDRHPVLLRGRPGHRLGRPPALPKASACRSTSGSPARPSFRP